MIGLLAMLSTRDPASRLTLDRDLLSRIIHPGILKLALDQDMELLAKIIRNPKAFGTGGLNVEEASKAIMQAKDRGDIRTAIKAMQEYDTAKWRGWLTTSGGKQYVILFERNENRLKGNGSKDNRRRPELPEGIAVARSLLPGIVDKTWLNKDWERGFLPEVMASCWLPPIGACNLDTLQMYIDGGRHERCLF